MKIKLVALAAIVSFIILPGITNADGGFFYHYQEDITEPSQKAVIFYNESNHLENLILQVRYEGNVSDFAWIVPLPNIPNMKEVDAEIFYELMALTAKNYDGRGFLAPNGKGKGNVTLIKREQVGIYDVSVLNATNASALLNWLNQNDYFIPKETESIIQYYINKGWCFAAIKIDIPAYIEEKVEGYHQLDHRIINLSTAEEYLIQDLVNDTLEKKSYEDSIAVNLDIQRDSYERWYREYWGREEYGEMKNLMYRIVNYSIWGEVEQNGWKKTIQKYEGYGIDAFNTYDLVDRLCYQIYLDMRGNKSYVDSITHVIGISIYSYDRWMEEYGGDKNLARLQSAVEWSVKEGMKIGDIENRLRYGNIQPISFIFESEKPIYPLKITSLNKNPTEILLYLFTHDEQTALHYDFSTEYAGWIKPEDVEHTKVLKKYVNEPLFLTKMRSVISPEEMDMDVEFSPSTSSSTVPGFLATGLIAILGLIILMKRKR